jgi:hypothetical protein
VGAAPVLGWEASFNGADDLDDGAKAVAVAPGGAVAVVAGYTRGVATDLDVAVAAYDTQTGAKLWSDRYNGPRSGNDVAERVAITPDGTKAIVAGNTLAGSTGVDMLIVAYAMNTGRRMWLSRFSGLPTRGVDDANAIAMSPDGTKVFVAGHSRGQSGFYEDFATVAYDTETGAELWHAGYDGPAALNDLAVDAAMTPDGSELVVVGRSSGGPGVNDLATVAYSSTTGEELWTARYRGEMGATDVGGVGVGADGATVLVTGGTLASDGGFDGLTIAYDALAGTEQWTARYSDSDSVTLAAQAVSPNGATAVVTGSTKNGYAFDYLTIAYDVASGTQLWVATYDGAHEYDSAQAVTITADSKRAIVTGTSGYVPSGDFAAISYRVASGVQEWVVTYNGPGDGQEFPTDVAEAAHDTVIVVGESEGITSSDFAAVGLVQTPSR